MKIIPRPYQEKSLKDIKQAFKQHQKVIMCLPTGAGKTVTFSYACQQVLKKDIYAKVLIITDRIELLTQAGNTLSSFGIKPYLISSKTRYVDNSAHCFVAMAKTLFNRLKKDALFLPRITLCIIDEAHEGAFRALMPYIDANEIYTIGATATPKASSNKFPLNDYFNTIVEGPQISELIEDGYLCKPRTFFFEKDLTSLKRRNGEFTNDSLMLNFDCENQYENVYKAYVDHGKGEKMLLFNCNISHSVKMCEYLKAKGLNARHLDSKTDQDTRKAVLFWFKTTPDAILCNCGILTKGYDEPSIKIVGVNRATLSITLFMQMCGRGSRTYKNKDHFKIFDFGNNVKSHGPWELDRDWTEIFNKNKIQTDGVPPIKTCKQCFNMCHTSHKICNECGYVFPITKKPEMQKMSLVEFEQNIPEKLARPLRELTVPELVERANIGSVNGKYSIYWVVNQICLRENPYEQLKELQEIKGYKSGWLYRVCKDKKIYVPKTI